LVLRKRRGGSVRLHPPIARAAACVCAVLVCLFAAPAFATVESELAFHKGVVAYGEERLDDAKALFEQVLEIDPNDTVSIHYLALIAQKQGDRARAKELIQRGLALDANDPDLLLDLGVIQLEAGETADARATFDRVLAAKPDDAKAQLFAGIAAYRAGAYSEALPHLDRAVAIDPKLALHARYYTGLSEAYLGNLPQAEGAFSDAETASPQHPLAHSAQRMRDQVRPAAEPQRPWTLALTAGGEWDSNPRVAGDTVPREDDYRGVWRARGSYRVLEKDGFTLTGGGEGYWSIHHDEDNVDLQTYLGFLNAGYAVGPLLFGLGYDFLYTFIDFDHNFRIVNRFTPSVSLREGDIGLTQLYYQYQIFRFFQNSQTSQLNLDGFENFVGVNQYIFLPAPISYIRFGALGDFVNTKGTEYQYDGYELFIGTSLALPFQTQFEVTYRFADRDFEFPSFFAPNEVRDEQIHRVTLELIKSVTEHIDVGINGSLGFRNTNIPVFEYNRYIAGGYVTYRF
jgi:tetratricopeptide (TPR) repeat protein